MAMAENEFRSQGKEAIRRMNLSAALESIRRAGSLSRTQLIKTLRLSRTTVFELVGQLSDLGLVIEDETPETSGVGRPSFVVRPSSGVLAISLNPESDALNAGLVTLDGRVVERMRTPYGEPLNPVATTELAGKVIQELRDRAPARSRVVGLGVAVPGQVERDSGIVRLAPRLGWQDVDIVSLLGRVVDLPVFVGNNARLATIAEHRAGVGRGFSDFIYLFAGAGGMGGATIVDDRIVVGKNGFAGELGHTRLSADEGRDFGGISGTLEAAVRRDDLLNLLGYTNLSDDELDELVRDVPVEQIENLARRQLQFVGTLIGNLANIFDPGRIAVGGFVGSLYRRFGDELDRSVRAVALPAIARGLEIVSATDTTTMVLLGAAEQVFEVIVSDPFACGDSGIATVR